jgi:EAL domain-containing protein (putative c-di-GMP-specific phosphodiesterase class I)
VVQQQRMWRKSGLAPTAVSINLSGLHFRQPHIGSRIKSLVYEQGGNPQDIELELTESVLMTDASTTIATLRELKESGFRLAIDDFGTGYSSLTYLRGFPSIRSRLIARSSKISSLAQLIPHHTSDHRHGARTQAAYRGRRRGDS